MVQERFDDFAIYKLEDAWPLIDQRDTRAQGRHERCVLEAYDTGADHNDFFRDAA